MTSTRLRAAVALLSFFVLVSLMPVAVLGDEGMFLPDTLTQLPLTKLKQRGLRIPITDIYNPNGPSIKDAVVIVDGGTGEFVSPEGLLLTNHHVAFDALVSASDPSKDYAANGYLAKSHAEELPARGYNVTITQDLKDVTDEVVAGISDTMSPEDRARAIQAKVRAIETSGVNPSEGISARVLPMNDGLIYYKFTYLNLPDVRIVYAPPKNIGFFGGDPDNFEWPRHDGDFTFMRVYTGPDGRPAEYSSSNVPYKPKKFLSLSMGGVKEGEFMMVMGYPGSTRRYRESYSVAYNQEIAMPFLIDLFTYQIQTLQKAGQDDPALRIKLESTIFSLSNELKNYEGSVLAMRRAGIVDQKRSQEAEFTRWINADPARKTKYGEVLPSLEKAYQQLNATAQRDLLLQQMFGASDLIGIASFAQRVAADKEKPEAERNPALGSTGVLRMRAQVPAVLAERNPTAERELLTYLLRKAAELPLRETQDPLIALARDLGPAIQQIQINQQAFNAVVQKWRPLLVRGMSEMRGTKPYPDANRTLRFTYGEVKGYIPRDAAIYQPFTHLSGVVEKDTGREPFDVPAKLKQLYRARDFGPYADGQDVPVNFLATTDIIGGNSGSPIMNGRGEQVGIVFDGNYEGLGNDFFYNDAKGRTIAVDIRYVLFIADKFGGAGYLLKELDIKNAPAALQRAA